MIRLEVEPYCQECQDFEADVERPECNLFFGTDPDGKKIELLTCSDTVIRCKYRISKVDWIVMQYPLCKYYLREQKTTRLQNICNSDSDYAQFAEGV